MTTGRVRQLGLLSRLLLGALGLAAAGALALALAAAWYWHQLPPLDKAVDYRPHEHLEVLTTDGVEIAEFGAERRQFVPFAQCPRPLRDAVLAVEDARYYRHGALSLRDMARALIVDLSGGRPQGASTITQQVARTFFLSTRRTPERKIKEALLAFQLEDRLSKDRILELYLNQIYLGEHAYGFAAAAQVYFGKPLAALSLAETAMLAGLPQNPANANPIVSPDLARKRQLWVLWRMRRTGVIDEKHYLEARAEKLVLRSPLFVDVSAQHVAEMARRAVVERLGDKAYTEGIHVYTTLRAGDQRAAHAALRRAVMVREREQPWRGPEDRVWLPDAPSAAAKVAARAIQDRRDDADLRLAVVLGASPRRIVAELAGGLTAVVTGASLDRVQAALAPDAPEALAIRRGSIVRLLAVPPESPTRARPGESRRGRPVENPRWALAQWPQTQAAFVALDPVTGRIRALVGGFDFDHDPVNRATDAARPAGASIAPFIDSAAFEHGVMPETLVDDTPLPPVAAQPAEADPGNRSGPVDVALSVRDALLRSQDRVSERLLRLVGLAPARDWIARFGLQMRGPSDDPEPSPGSSLVTPLDLALGYAVLANGGHRVDPVLIDRITGAHGQLLYAAATPPALGKGNRVVPARNAFLVDSLLADATRRGPAAPALQGLQRPDLCGQAATGPDDAWFAGFAPGVVGVAWMGHDGPADDAGPPSNLAIPIWVDAMRAMLQGVPIEPVADMLPPPGIVASGDDWRYSEWADRSGPWRLDDPALSPADASPAASDAAASSPAAAASAAPH